MFSYADSVAASHQGNGHAYPIGIFPSLFDEDYHNTSRLVCVTGLLMPECLTQDLQRFLASCKHEPILVYRSA